MLGRPVPRVLVSALDQSHPGTMRFRVTRSVARCTRSDALPASQGPVGPEALPGLTILFAHWRAPFGYSHGRNRWRSFRGIFCTRPFG